MVNRNITVAPTALFFCPQTAGFRRGLRMARVLVLIQVGG